LFIGAGGSTATVHVQRQPSPDHRDIFRMPRTDMFFERLQTKRLAAAKPV